MKKMIGSPGTMSGLMLRLGQCATSSASIGVMVSSFGFSRYTAFCFLVASMGLEMIWSLGLACLDVYAIRLKSDIQSPIFLSLFTVGDWVTALLSLAAACSSAGVTVLFTKDTEFCRPYVRFVMFLVGTLTRDGEDGVVSSNPRRSSPSLRRSDVRNPPEEESSGSLM